MTKYDSAFLENLTFQCSEESCRKNTHFLPDPKGKNQELKDEIKDKKIGSLSQEIKTSIFNQITDLSHYSRLIL